MKLSKAEKRDKKRKERKHFGRVDYEGFELQKKNVSRQMKKQFKRGNK
jgi:hypothetical protein